MTFVDGHFWKKDLNNFGPTVGWQLLPNLRLGASLFLTDEYGGLIGLLADAPAASAQPDADRLAELEAHGWGAATIEAVIHSQSVRQAARLAGVHHSTMQTRIDTITTLLGFDPFDGFGKPRLGTAYLVWRLRRSRVLELPSPTKETRT